MHNGSILKILFLVALIFTMSLILIAPKHAHGENPLADLKIESVENSPASPDENQYVRWSIEIKNIGEAESAPFYVSIDNDINANVNPIHEKRMSRIEINGTRTVTFEHKATSGETLYFGVDSRLEVDESDEDNNVSEGYDLNDMLLPNLSVFGNVLPSSQSYSVGEPAEWVVTVKNIGPGNSDVFEISMGTSESLANILQSHTGNILVPSQTQEFTFERDAMVGEILYFFIDPYNLIEETEESDNTSQVNLSVV